MIVNIHLRTSKFISFQRTANSKIQKLSISLGKSLVKKLGLDSSVDTFSRWMVHYLVEQIITVKLKKGSVRFKAKQNFHETFKKLKQHQTLPSHKKHQFESWEPILTVLRKIGLEVE